MTGNPRFQSIKQICRENIMQNRNTKSKINVFNVSESKTEASQDFEITNV